MLIERCIQAKTRAVCIREVQVTIRDSVRQLLMDKIEKLGVSHLFEVVESEIRGVNGSLIVFRGMQNYNAENIKSLEDFDIAWVEEAQTLSAHSLKLLRPTIRNEGSELWFSWNPRHDTDAVDTFFRGKSPPRDSVVVAANWYDNPWFPDVLKREKEDDYTADPELAEHVWGGGYETITEAAYYARHIVAAEKAGRVGSFPYDPSMPVFTSWDLGVDDYTVVWFWQVFDETTSPRVRVIDFYEASGLGADDIMAEALPEYTKDGIRQREMMEFIGRPVPYVYGKHFLPHDVGNREWGAGAKTRIQTLVGLGMPLSKINRGVAQAPDERINAVRALLPIVEFNQSDRVMKGVRHLRRYSRKMNRQLGTYLGPLHDEHSHASDAFGEFAINCGIVPKPPAQPEDERQPENVHEMTYAEFEAMALRSREEGVRA